MTAEPKRGRGRPSLGSGARRHVITLRLDDEQLAAIHSAIASETASGEAPSTVASWILDHALDPLGLARHDVRDYDSADDESRTR